MLVLDALEIGPRPQYFHVPLVLGPDGHRLAKRHGDTRVAAYRDADVPAERIVGLLAHTCGLSDRPAPMSAAGLLPRVRLRTRLPPSPCTLTPEHDAWLRQPS